MSFNPLIKVFLNSRDASEKLESARCLTNEAIQIIQDKICTAANEDVKNNLWVEHVSYKGCPWGIDYQRANFWSWSI